MKRRLPLIVTVFLAFAPAACAPPSLEPSPPLTIAEWKALPVEKKYAAETFERLKEGEPSLTTAEGWLAFQRSVVTPNRKREQPKRP